MSVCYVPTMFNPADVPSKSSIGIKQISQSQPRLNRIPSIFARSPVRMTRSEPVKFWWFQRDIERLSRRDGELMKLMTYSPSWPQILLSNAKNINERWGEFPVEFEFNVAVALAMLVKNSNSS